MTGMLALLVVVIFHPVFNLFVGVLFLFVFSWSVVFSVSPHSTAVNTADANSTGSITCQRGKSSPTVSRTDIHYR